MRMNKPAKKLPGTGMRVLSFIPAVNWISLLYIGIVNSDVISILCGAGYGVLTFAFPSISPLLWFVGIIQYAIMYRIIRNKLGVFSQPPPTYPNNPIPPQTQYQNIAANATSYTEVRLPGRPEQRQSIPARPQSGGYTAYPSMYSGGSREKFFQDMAAYVAYVGAPAPFQPFMSYWPTYDSMSREQQAWYFYWRSQARMCNYLDTDLSYIFIHIYELLSGVGWSTPEDGYEQLLHLWSAYRLKFPKLDNYLQDWLFDFAQLYQLNNMALPESASVPPGPSVMTDIIVDRHAEEVPLKLPFSIVDALCDYSLVNSKFYKEGHQELMVEAIPRVIALADASLRKKTQKGILATYGPTRPRKQEYYAFRSAVCPNANQKMAVSVKAYSSNPKLRGYVNELVRCAENTLRAYYGYRGRLRGVILDEETAKLVASFLEKEYSRATTSVSSQEKKVKVELNFSAIQDLRQQSDEVRSALLVENQLEPQKELLTDVQEVMAIYIALSESARELLNQLSASSWESDALLERKPEVDEINRFSEHYLGCALLVCENERLMAEDDYRDELDYIYENPPPLRSEDSSVSIFDSDALPPEFSQLIEALMPEQKKALYVLLTEEHPQQILEQIAEEAMTMPQILLDGINETSVPILGDILIDTMDLEPCLLGEYKTVLKQSIV